MYNAMPESQRSSGKASVQCTHHCQPLAWKAKPPRRGPRVGPSTAAQPQMPSKYEMCWGANMSASVAPPVARAGLPKKLARKHIARTV